MKLCFRMMKTLICLALAFFPFCAAVSCGQHEASSCAECVLGRPAGHEPSWCNGQCEWSHGGCRSSGPAIGEASALPGGPGVPRLSPGPPGTWPTGSQPAPSPPGTDPYLNMDNMGCKTVTGGRCMFPFRQVKNQCPSLFKILLSVMLGSHSTNVQPISQ